MECRETTDGSLLEEWACHFPPSDVILRNLATGEEQREISLVAVRVERMGGEAFPAKVQRYLASGKAAQAYRDTPDTVVFSPLRQGQIANYAGAVYLFRRFLRQLSPGIRLLKPVLYIHIQKQTTEVEKLALFDAGIQAGARKVFLYQESLSALPDFIPSQKGRGIVFHIGPQEKL